MLTNAENRRLKAEAQHLEPVVFLGKNGITAEFLQSVDQALANRELIKVRFAAFKDQRQELAGRIAVQTGCCLVTVIGHVAVLYRRKPGATTTTASPPVPERQH